MPSKTADVVICGAGIAGIATAYYLSVTHGVRDVLLVDERPPLSLTSDKSTECYRNWWPGPGNAMVSLMNDSIDLLETLAHATGNIFNLNRRGYVYATADPARIAVFAGAAEEAAALGAGAVRYHTGQGGQPSYVPAPAEGFENQPDGADLISDAGLLAEYFPYLSPDTLAVVHARRCGWLSAQTLGIAMLEWARVHGVRLLPARVEGVSCRGGRVQGVRVATEEGDMTVATPCFVNAAGPFVAEVGRLLDVTLPVFCERHLKLAFLDYLHVVPRHAPFLVWADAQHLAWDDDERAWLAESEETAWMLDAFPAGVHTRPDGPADSPIALMLWDYHRDPVGVVLPVPPDPLFPEIVLRGLSTMIPALRAYFGRLPKPVVDGGYYTKTRENRPLIGPLPVAGAYVLGALSGYGVMAAPAAGVLLAAHIVGASLPDYAPAFAPARYDDPAYQVLLENWGTTGQL